MSDLGTPHPLASTIARLGRHLPGALASPAAHSRLLTVCGSIPAALTHGIYLESRLSAGARVDLVTRVDERGRTILAGADRAIRLPRQFRAHPHWDEVRRLCVEWGDPDSPLAPRLRGVWLEFDTPAPGDEATVPLPGVFLKLTESALTGPAAAPEEVLASLPGLAPGLCLVQRLRRCIDELPQGAHVSYLGSFASRGTDAVRACMVGLPEDAIPAYLARVGWPGDPRALGDFLRDASTADGRRLHRGPGMLHLDVGGDGVQPRIGLEYVLERGGQIRGRLHETEFLDHLVDLGLCAAARRDGLLAWPGYSFEDFAHELWPSLVKRRVNHVKLVYEPGRPPEAKAYLCAFSEFYRGKTHPREEEHHGRAAPATV